MLAPLKVPLPGGLCWKEGKGGTVESEGPIPAAINSMSGAVCLTQQERNTLHSYTIYIYDPAMAYRYKKGLIYPFSVKKATAKISCSTQNIASRICFKNCI
jgi:hypothetical protein